MRRTTITKDQYERGIPGAMGIKKINRFGSKIETDPRSKEKTIFRVATLRRRKPGAFRKSLKKAAAINSNVNVLNPNKAHGIADIHGGPESPENLVLVPRKVNLSLHKRAETAIDRTIVERSGPNSSPTAMVGSMKMEEKLDASGKSVSRLYYVHYKAGSGKPEKFEKFTIKVE